MIFNYRYKKEYEQFPEESLELLTKTGIYKIWHLNYKPNLVVYVGSASAKKGNTIRQGFRLRWTRHLDALKHNKHCNKYLQSIVNKYGIKGLRFEILEICNPEETEILENKWIKLLKAYEIGYNATPNAKVTLGFKMYEEVLVKRRKPLLQYDLEGNFIKEWGSRSQVSSELKIQFNKNTIDNKHKQAGGFLWRYKKNKLFPLKIDAYLHTTKQRIICYNLSGKFLKEYDSLLSASKDLNVPVANISKALNLINQFRKIACGYLWEYYTNDYPMNIDPFIPKTGNQKRVLVTNIDTGETLNCISQRQAAKYTGLCRGHFAKNENKIIKNQKTKINYKLEFYNA